jgi:hypothetical protein
MRFAIESIGCALSEVMAMVSKSTIQLGFRFPIRYIGLIDDEAKAQGWSRAQYVRDVLTWALNGAQGGGASIKKFLFYDRLRRERVRLTGKSIVIAVRLSGELASGIRAQAELEGNNVSEWCGKSLLRAL